MQECDAMQWMKKTDDKLQALLNTSGFLLNMYKFNAVELCL